MMHRFKPLLALLLFSQTLFAQPDSSGLLKNFLTRNFNVGISAGIGSGHAGYVLPSPVIKLGRLELQGSQIQSRLTDISGFQAELNAIPIETKSQTEQYFCLAFGSMLNRNFPIRDRQIWSNEVLVGYNRFKLNKRTKFSAKIGIGFTRIDNLQDRYKGDHIHPTMELSYTWSALKYIPKDNAILSKHVYQWRMQKLRPWLAHYFNPYISLGVGADRFIAMPAIGIRSGRVGTKLSLFNDGTAGAGGGIGIDVDLKPLKPRSNYSQNLSIMLSSMSYGIADGGQDGYFYVHGLSIGKSMIKKEGRHRLAFHVGIGRYDHDIYTAEPFFTKKLPSITPLADFSYDVYLFNP